MNFLPVLSSGGGTAGAIGILIAYIAVFAVLMYFLSVRPQKKRQKKMDKSAVKRSQTTRCSGTKTQSRIGVMRKTMRIRKL